MSRDDNIIFWLLLVTLLVCYILSKEMSNYHIPRSEWKCKQAIVINDDPSNTECTMYVKTDKVVD